MATIVGFEDGHVIINDDSGFVKKLPISGATDFSQLTGTVLQSQLPSNQIPANTAIKPSSSLAIQYVTAQGNDTNDGLSWGTAKLTISAALISLPGGSVSPPTCGNGTVFVSDGVSANSVAGAGIWLMGPNDPNYKSPPLGWLRLPGGGLQIIGVGGKANAADSRIGQCSILAGNSADNNHPAIWLSSTSSSLYFANLSLPANITSIRMAIDSTGVRSTDKAGVNNSFFENVAGQMGLAPATNGPTVDIGSNSFFNGFRDCVFAANANAVAGSDLAASMLLNPGTGTGVGIIFIEDTNLAGGYLKFYPGINGGGFYLNGMTIEGLTGTNGGIWITSTNSNVNIQIQNLQLADTVGVTPAIEVDGNGPPDSVIVSNTNGPLVGPLVVQGITPSSTSSSNILPGKYHQCGFVGGRVIGQIDSARRNGGATGVRFSNLAVTNPSLWTFTPNGSVKTGIIDLFGSTQAGTGSSSSGNVNILFYDANRTYAIGDIIIIGVWARSQNGNGFRNTLSINLVSSGFSLQDVSGQGTISSQPFLNQYIMGDGANGNPPSQWDWYYGVFKVTTVGTNPTETQFIGPVDDIHSTDYFAPIFLHIPTGTISDNEASELGLHLQSYPTSAVVGQFWDMVGQVSHMIASGTAALGTSQIASNVCAATVTVSAPGVLSTDTINWSFSADPNGVNGYGAGSGGPLIIYSFPTTDHVNFRVCNLTAAAITPGAATLNWKVIR